MSSLYQLTSEYEELIDALEDAQNEDEAAAVLAKLDELSGAIENKAEVYARIIKSKQAEAEALKAEADRLTGKRKCAENAADRLKTRLLTVMQETGRTEIPTAIGKWRIQANPLSCEITDESKLPRKYFIPQPDKIDKAAMLRDYKATGELIDGATFEQKQGLRFK